MNNFMIGQYGSFDYKKFSRDFRNEFFGIEACLFTSEEDVGNLIKELLYLFNENGINL